MNYKPTKKQLGIMSLYWKMFQAEEATFWGRMGDLEREMSKKAKIKDLEFFQCDNEFVGIGQSDRKMELIQREKLE
jgi:hypothetical protein